MLSVTGEQFPMIYCDAAARRRRAIVQTTAPDASPACTGRVRLLAIKRLCSLILMLILLSEAWHDTEEQAYRCLSELLSLIRNTLRSVMIASLARTVACNREL